MAIYNVDSIEYDGGQFIIYVKDTHGTDTIFVSNKCVVTMTKDDEDNIIAVIE